MEVTNEKGCRVCFRSSLSLSSPSPLLSCRRSTGTRCGIKSRNTQAVAPQSSTCTTSTQTPSSASWPPPALSSPARVMRTTNSGSSAGGWFFGRCGWFSGRSGCFCRCRWFSGRVVLRQEQPSWVLRKVGGSPTRMSISGSSACGLFSRCVVAC